MRTSMEGIALHLLSVTLCSILTITNSLDTITATQSIRDGDTMVSAKGSFELGFFSPNNSKSRYLGIWYNKISILTVVWVANREIPITDSSGVLKLSQSGILELYNGTNTIIWSSNSSRPAKNPAAKILDSGNLVVREENDDLPENYFWQSFDYPCDTHLPGMKLGRNRASGLDRYLSSWKTFNDPSQGDYISRVDPNGFPQIFLMKNSDVQCRSGPWNGPQFSGAPGLKSNSIYKFNFVFNQEEIYYSYELVNSSVLSRMVLMPSGDLQRYTWIDRMQGWVLYSTGKTDFCDRYGLCGAYGSCDINNSPVCGCLRGFEPKFPRDWGMADWSNGCVRKVGLDCQSQVGFVKFSGLKLPDTRFSWFDQNMTLEECEKVCLKNCSCTAYTHSDVREEGWGCLIWFGDLIDIRELNEGGREIYIKMDKSEVDQMNNQIKNSKSRTRRSVKIIVSSLLSTGVLGLALVVFVWMKKKHQRHERVRWWRSYYKDESQNEDLELPYFDLVAIAKATNNFSIGNKLGQGGFGPVYKGELEDGQEIAVKRLSKNSRQGLVEFKNEVRHIAKLQHRNLVKLLGCCIEKEEMMLIYEFMPNKSLDCMIFDQAQNKLLDWPKRFDIIKGVAQGLLYLHRDSRLRIIHRDLKAGNVLLDSEMNPKISDFGIARSFGDNEAIANTKRVIGTYGYMSPEYAIEGLYSVKSDVFSFGVMVLEIISGKRNRGFQNPDHCLNLLGHAWKLYLEGKGMDFLDVSLMGSCDLSEALRSIHVGLLCVQRSPQDRPSMSSVVLMLGSEGAVVLPKPKQPGFFTEREMFEAEFSSNRHEASSTNEFTITVLEAR